MRIGRHGINGVKIKQPARKDAIAFNAMRYYPAFGVKSGRVALFTRFLNAGNRFAEALRRVLERLGPSSTCFFHRWNNPKKQPQKAMDNEVCSCLHRTLDHV